MEKTTAKKKKTEVVGLHATEVQKRQENQKIFGSCFRTLAVILVSDLSK